MTNYKLWYNARIASFSNESIEPCEQCCIITINDKIHWLGKQAKLPRKIKDNITEVFDVKKQLITPGLIDCHTHLVYAGNRANEFSLRQQGISYQDIAKQGGGILATVKATRAASFDELYQQSEQRLKNILREGITTIEIKSGYGLDLETEIKCLRVAKRLANSFPVTIKKTYLGAHVLPPEFNSKDDYIDFICNSVIPKLVKEKLIDAIDGFCETMAFSAQQLEKVFQSAKKYQIPIKLHTEQLSRQQGVGLACKYQALSVDHLEYAELEDIQLLSQNNIVAVLLPGAFYYLKETQKPAVELMRQYQVPIAIATDCNPGTSPTTSLLLMANTACNLFGLTTQEALLGITINAAKALGIADTLGSLTSGKIADFVIWDIKHPNELINSFGYTPNNRVVKNASLINK